MELYKKIVQSGDLIEVYTYERTPAPRRNGIRSAYKRKKTRKANLQTKRSHESIQRAYNQFRRKVRTNLYHQKTKPHFVTLTMLEITTLPIANKLLTKFIAKLRKHEPQHTYIAVPEFQKRGAVHYHILVWGLPHDTHISEIHTRRLQGLWGYGYVDVIATDGHPKIAAYMAKYMQKAMRDDRLVGNKAYTSTRQLMRSVSLNTPFQITCFESEWGNVTSVEDIHIPDLELVHSRDYVTKWLGRATLKVFNAKIQNENNSHQ